MLSKVCDAPQQIPAGANPLAPSGALTNNPDTLSDAVNAFLAEHLAPREQPQTRRFNNQPYDLLATGLDIRPGPSGCKKRWGDRCSNFRVVLGRDGAWAVYGLQREGLTGGDQEIL